MPEDCPTVACALARLLAQEKSCLDAVPQLGVTSPPCPVLWLCREISLRPYSLFGEPERWWHTDLCLPT